MSSTGPRHRVAARRSCDRGSAALELVVIAPALLLIVAVLVYAGRVAIARQAVQQAADDAAREASIAVNAGTAQTDAHDTAVATLGQQGLSCSRTAVSVDTSAFNAPAGTPATVTATVTCVVALRDLAVPGLPGTHAVRATGVSVLDTYRQRTTG